ncbi:MAG: hypothetical protein JW807_09660 [Spirochaetes bacterium]|nr:hypothetical protein [Spirochaetota bacterium]
MGRSFTWQFPEIIEFFDVPEYLETFEKVMSRKLIIFDMTDTLDAHSAFIGFLIHVKKQMEARGCRPVFKTSPYIKKTISMLGMNEYFQ